MLDAKVAVVQLDCVLGEVQANVRKIERFVSMAAAHGSNLIVVPELGTTGYFVGERLGELAEPIPGPTTRLLAEIARRSHAYLVTGIAERADDGHLYNASVLLSPEGRLVGRYRKCHLFSTERQFFTPGDDPAVFDTEFGRVALTICYDLVFPEYIRSLVDLGAQLIVNSTDWITDAWQTSVGWSGVVVSHLAATRALENTVHVAMANRVGMEAGWKSLGHSCVCAPSGAFLTRIEEGEGIATADVSLDNAEWQRFRSIASYLDDRRMGLYSRLHMQG